MVRPFLKVLALKRDVIYPESVNKTYQDITVQTLLNCHPDIQQIHVDGEIWKKSSGDIVFWWDSHLFATWRSQRGNVERNLME